MMSVLVLVAAGCTNSGLGQPTGETADSGAGPVEVSCPWVGDWSLTTVSCGSFPVDAWFVDHDGATMTVEQHADGGCALTVTVTGPSCGRTERWRLSAPSGLEADAVYEGITSCDPDGCSFSTEEPACAVAAAEVSQTVRVEDTSGDLVLEAILADTAPECSLGVITTWATGA